MDRTRVESHKEVSFPDLGIVFVWHGGAYVDICTMGRERKAFEVINVWDDEKNAIQVPYTVHNLRGIAKEWISENKELLPDYFLSVR